MAPAPQIGFAGRRVFRRRDVRRRRLDGSGISDGAFPTTAGSFADGTYFSVAAPDATALASAGSFSHCGQRRQNADARRSNRRRSLSDADLAQRQQRPRRDGRCARRQGRFIVVLPKIDTVLSIQPDEDLRDGAAPVPLYADRYGIDTLVGQLLAAQSSSRSARVTPMLGPAPPLRRVAAPALWD
jgi:hypothetical protein